MLPENVPELLQEGVRQLAEYFEGKRKIFDLPLAPKGTDFQQQVWKEMLAVPFGQTTTYLAIALKIGDRKLSRAVGAASGSNPIAIIIPCHRVIGTSGSLTGYAGGLETKRDLLMHENPMVFGKQGELF